MKLQLLALVLLTATSAAAQDNADISPSVAREFAPDGVRYMALAADSILSSGAGDSVSLEAFDSGLATGVYLYGTFRGERESVGYGRDPDERRYLWFSVERGDSLDFMVMLYDVDHDLTPDFLLFRSVDRKDRVETLTEYAAPALRQVAFDISIQPACAAPRCDPATWTVHEKRRIDVPEYWFEMWRPVLSIAAMRGERWLGRPVASLPKAPDRP